MNFIKKIAFVAVSGLLFVSCKDTSKENTTVTETPVTKTETPVIAGKTETTSFTVDGMSCAVMCATKIEKELTGQEGVQEAKVDFDTKTATVKYDSAKQTPEKLVKIVENVAGGDLYKVSDVKTTHNPA